MSMNLNVFAKLGANTKLGRKTLMEKFNLWQTPTTVTRKCLASGNPCAAYIEWVLEVRVVKKFPLYEQGDIFEEGPIVGYQEYCAAEEHSERLKHWIEEHSGWDIEWFET